MNILSYHVFDGNCMWLAEDEKKWTRYFHDSASFTNAQLAQDVGEREAGDRTIYVMGCMGWQ